MDLLGFALAVLLIELTPGPNMAWMAGLAATEGRRVGFAAMWGVALGLLLNGLFAALGLAALLQAEPRIWTALRMAGAAMMVWLSVETWRGAGDPAHSARGSKSVKRAFLSGLMINLFNPKAYIFFVVMAPQFLGGQPLGMRQAAALTAISVTVATIIHGAIIIAGAHAHDWLADPARTRLVRRCFAIIMLGVAVSFMLADHR